MATYDEAEALIDEFGDLMLQTQDEKNFSGIMLSRVGRERWWASRKQKEDGCFVVLFEKNPRNRRDIPKSYKGVAVIIRTGVRFVALAAK